MKKIIADLRHSLSLVATLPDPLQRGARDAYAASLKTVFILAACSPLTAYVVRLPVRPCLVLFSLHLFTLYLRSVSPFLTCLSFPIPCRHRV